MRRRSPKVVIFVAGIAAVLVVAVTSAAMFFNGDGPAKRDVASTDAVKRAPTPVRVVVFVDRARTETMTTGRTVREVLTRLGIRVGPYDLVHPGLDGPTAPMIKVVRLLSRPVTKVVQVPPPTVKKKNKAMYVWDEKVLRKGRPGVKVVRTAYVRRHGKKVKAIIAQVVKRRPEPRILEVGTKGAPVGGAAARLNWKALAECESHGNPRAVNGAGYYGLYQFSTSSWASAGGSGKPSDATAAEQTYRAQLLYNRVHGRWQGQWPSCGRLLFS
ncbi:MAG: Transglycosylase domain protein [Streptosporangiaceae bacterium]|nr:Transglycosylase domain protein [Streptosporangiaceae bacterium]